MLHAECHLVSSKSMLNFLSLAYVSKYIQQLKLPTDLL